MEKFKSVIEISELIARDISGQLGPQEKILLKEWLNSSEGNQKLYRKILDKENFRERNNIYESVDVKRAWSGVKGNLEIQGKKRVLTVLLRYAAAILVPLLFGITAYWYLNDQPQKSTQSIVEIEPGSSNAVLVMANGENVNLTDTSKRKLVEHDGTIIQNNNEELTYAGTNANKTKETLLNTLVVPHGGEYRLILSDGTRVSLNSMSKLVFPTRFSGSKREVTLEEGEAYIEVTKDKSKPFIVTYKGMQIEVLGTTFNIKAYPDDHQVFTTLVEGRVKINFINQLAKNCFLEPDQQAAFDPSDGGIVVRKVDAKQIVQWTKGKYSFTDQPLDEIMKTLSRWYDFNYQYEDEALKRIRFEGGLDKYESIGPILDIIARTGKVKVSVKGKEVMFTRI